MEPAILMDKSRDLLFDSATQLPSRLDSPIGTTSSISTMPPNSPTPPTIPASTGSQVQDIVLPKESPAVEFLKFPKLPLELRRLVFRKAMPRPALFTIQQNDQFAFNHGCQLPEWDYEATNCSEWNECLTLQPWSLVNFTILDSGISFYSDEVPTEAIIHRNPALRSICKESLVEFDLVFPFSLVLKPESYAIPQKSHDPYRFYFNKHDIIYLHCLSPTSRLCGFPNMMASYSWTKHIEILYVPFGCFKRGTVDSWEELARGLMGVMKAFPALKEVRTSNRDIWETYSCEVKDWSAEYIDEEEGEGKGTEDTGDDNEEDTDEELDEDSQEEEEGNDDGEGDNGGEEIEAHDENSEQDDGSDDGEEGIVEEYKQEDGGSEGEEEVEVPDENSEQQDRSDNSKDAVDEDLEQENGGGDGDEELVEVWEDEEVTEDDDDDDDDSEEESDEDDYEPEEENEGVFEPQLVEEIIEALEETDCVMKGEVKIPVIKVYIARSGMIWNSTRDIQHQEAMTSD